MINKDLYSGIELVDKLTTENEELKEILKEVRNWFSGMIGSMNNNYSEHNKSLPIGNFESVMRTFLININKVLKEKGKGQ